MKKKNNFLKVICRFIFFVPLFIGFVSYRYAGESVSDALYYSIELYGFNFEKPEVFILWLEIAKWMAPLMTATSIILIMKTLLSYLQVHILAFRSDSNIVYGDSEYAGVLCENEKRTVMCTEAPISRAKHHFIMFDSDIDNFSFCQKYLKRMAGKNIYLCIDEMDTTLLKEEFSEAAAEGTQIKFFNPNDVIARSFWKERRLWENAKEEYKIAIIGFGNLGKRILEKALQLNLFSVNQRIEYYVFGDSRRFELTHSHMDLMNRDKILYYDADSKEQWDLLRTMDMIILTDGTDVDLIQNVLGCTSPASRIYYYSPSDDNISRYISTDRLFSYGNNQDIFTLENIKTDNLYENAIRLNKNYVDKYNGPEWEALSGFLKESNISAADYGEVIRTLVSKGLEEIELAELEHVRWSRFHFLRYWRYGIPANGANKDAKEKIHKCLIPFEKLDESEQQKDVEVVQMWKKER